MGSRELRRIAAENEALIAAGGYETEDGAHRFSPRIRACIEYPEAGHGALIRDAAAHRSDRAAEITVVSGSSAEFCGCFHAGRGLSHRRSGAGRMSLPGEHALCVSFLPGSRDFLREKQAAGQRRRGVSFLPACGNLPRAAGGGLPAAAPSENLRCHHGGSAGSARPRHMAPG